MFVCADNLRLTSRSSCIAIFLNPRNKIQNSALLLLSSLKMSPNTDTHSYMFAEPCATQVVNPSSRQVLEGSAAEAVACKFGDVRFDLSFEQGRMSATGYVAKISMLRRNIGSGKLSSCMLSIGRGPKAVQGKGGGLPLPCLVRIGV